MKQRHFRISRPETALQPGPQIGGLRRRLRHDPHRSQPFRRLMDHGGRSTMQLLNKNAEKIFQQGLQIKVTAESQSKLEGDLTMQIIRGGVHGAQPARRIYGWPVFFHSHEIVAMTNMTFCLAVSAPAVPGNRERARPFHRQGSGSLKVARGSRTKSSSDHSSGKV